jgi:tRNA pseudouridine-54 N-methylase
VYRAGEGTTSRTSIAGSLGTVFCHNATNASFVGHFLKTAVNVALVLGDLESAGNIPH